MPRVELAAAKYGKDNIRVYKVVRDAASGTQTVYEMTICVMLEGDIAPSYTVADNSCVVATDTMKNTVYILAKKHEVHPPELFAATITNHFLEKYPQIHAAHVKIVCHRWTRMIVNGQPHPHSFLRDGNETRNVDAVFREGTGLNIRSSIVGLLVLKSTGSAFHSFIRDDFTTLPETNDRILSTEVDATWQWKTFDSLKQVEAEQGKFDKAWEAARETTLTLFAVEESPSVQNTMFKMGEEILAAVPDVIAVDYSLPNKHYFEIDLSYHHGLQNKGKDAEVFAPQSNPNGLITCTVSRDGKLPPKL